MKLIPHALARSRFPHEETNRLRNRLQEFLETADLAESSLIIDGSGLGLAAHIVVLSLLGSERFSCLRSIHSTSASAYGVLYFVARERGMLQITPEMCDDFNRANQVRHHITGCARGSRLALQFLLGSRGVFDNARTEEALAYGVGREFQDMKVSELPDNVSFLTYCVEDREVCEIHRDSRFADWSMGELIRCVTAVKGVYTPFRKAHKTYMDAVTNRPLLRELYRSIRKRHQHVLVLHMDRDEVHGNTTFLKMHDTGPGRLRILADFLYFMCGVRNQAFDDAIRMGLFEVQPL